MYRTILRVPTFTVVALALLTACEQKSPENLGGADASQVAATQATPEPALDSAALCGLFELLDDWFTDDDLSTDSWDRFIAVARVVQKAPPGVVEAALWLYEQRAEESNQYDGTSAMLLLLPTTRRWLARSPAGGLLAAARSHVSGLACDLARRAPPSLGLARDLRRATILPGRALPSLEGEIRVS
jgi:hypothetical protein